MVSFIRGKDSPRACVGISDASYSIWNGVLEMSQVSTNGVVKTQQSSCKARFKIPKIIL